MEHKNSPIDKIVEIGEKAVDSAKELFEKAKPVVEEGAQKAVDGAKDAYGKIRPKVEEGTQKAVEAVKDAFEHLTGKQPATDEASTDETEIVDTAVTQPDAAVPEEEMATKHTIDVHEEIAAHVDQQVAQIRSAQHGTDMIHDYFERKLEEPDTPNE